MNYTLHGSDCDCVGLCSVNCQWRYLGQSRTMRSARQWALEYKRRGIRRVCIFRNGATLGRLVEE